MDNSHGLSIYLIDSPAEYDSSYDLLRFANDTQWDEFLLSGEGVVTGVEVIATTRQIQTTGVGPEVVSIFEEESDTSKDYQIININNGLKGETVNSILVLWDAYYGVDGYRVYRKANSGEFSMIFEWPDPPSGYLGYAIQDLDISEGNTYSYYVTAYGTDWETTPSEIVTITITSETFLPPCSLSNPIDDSIITDTNPVFSWSPVGLGSSDLPYGQVDSGRTLLGVYDVDTSETAWYIWFDDMITSSATYNQDGSADPLIPGHVYKWYVYTYGYDNNGNWVASSHSETWEFDHEEGVIPSSVYRAFLVGVGDYQNFPDTHGNIDLSAPPFDVDRMHDILSHSASGFFSISELIDLQATKSAISNGIANAFSGADSDDVSYFYFTGHGINDSGVSYLCPTNVSYYSFPSSYISTNELESALSAIPGTKVVILDCCHSGGFIGKQIGEENIFTDAQEFNDDVINVFLSKDLNSSQYKVLTSCLSSQVCWELIPSEGDPFGLFSGILCEGCGYNYYTHPYFADGNGNGEITLHEAYIYTDEQVTIAADYLNTLHPDWGIDQDTQVYPLNSDFLIVEE
jgi:hypothetical protein